MSGPRCRFCSSDLTVTFADLGMSPISNAFLTAEQLGQMEPFYPLHAWVCGDCTLVQLEQFQSPEKLFSDYAYFSSYSQSWLDHCRGYAEMMIERLGLGPRSTVVELASNDGYLLQFFKQRGIPVLGVEPAANVAKVAIEKGIPTEVAFFGRRTADRLVQRGCRADLLVGNNVLAHVPDINDFVGGMKTVLAPRGTVTMEFPHLLRLIENNEFDTIYHEHFSYLSFLAAKRIFEAGGLRLFDVEQIPTHGGSLRVYACHAADERAALPSVAALLGQENRAGLEDLATYRSFDRKVQATKRGILEFLVLAKQQGKRIVGYGAPAKGNTLLNYCGIRRDFLDFTVDRSPHKQGRFLPGTHIPILPTDALRKHRPDYVFILPWNLKDEIMEQVGYIRDWGGKFIVPIPQVTVYP
jgi:hypothetical protein